MYKTGKKCVILLIGCERMSEKNKKLITMEMVIKGLKFIAENQSLTREELKFGLLELGCDFTHEDIKEQFPQNIGLFEGMAQGNISCGANVIVNMRESDYGKSYGQNRFLSIDDGTSVYHFIRVVTGDNSYTKENISKKVSPFWWAKTASENPL